MAIDPQEPCFPNNAVKLLVERFQIIDEDVFTIARPLRMTDPNLSIGVYASNWNPDNDSYELKGAASPGPSEPTIQRYLINIDSFVKHMDEAIGLAQSAVLSKLIRTMLYRDTTLRVALAALNVETSLATEKLQRWGIRTQRFANNEIPRGQFLYLSTLEFWLETEIT